MVKSTRGLEEEVRISLAVATSLATLAPSFPSSAQSQIEFADCGALSDTECLLVETTLHRWNSQFGESIRAVGFKYTGGSDGETVNRIFGENSTSSAFTIDEQGLPRVFPISDIFQDPRRAENAFPVLERFQSVQRNLPSTIEILWQFNGQSFTTEALVGPSFPYLLDTMIGSVVLVVDPKSTLEDTFPCDYVTISLFSLVQTGYYYANFYSTLHRSAVDGSTLSCKTLQAGENFLGKMAFSLDEVAYIGNSCSQIATVEYTAPFASVKVGVSGATVEVTALGGGWRRQAICKLP
jgi:hypothetical protein